jgi:hypothetical protein
LAGGQPEIVHINQLMAGERKLLDYAMLIVPGGFSYGDDLGAGVLWAVDLQQRFAGGDAGVCGKRPSCPGHLQRLSASPRPPRGRGAVGVVAVCEWAEELLDRARPDRSSETCQVWLTEENL